MCIWLALSGWLAGVGHAQTYTPFEWDGQKVMGRPVQFKDTHIQIAIQGDGVTNVAWGRLSQATLQHLLQVKNFDAYARPFIDPAPQNAPQGPKVTTREVQRLDRPTAGGLFASPVMFLVFFLLYAANVYAGYEVAVYRQRNTALVASLAAVMPVLAPVIFLALPSTISQAPVEEETTAEAMPETIRMEGQAEPDATPQAAGGSAPAKSTEPVMVFPRGQFTFNRRFFETKLAGFLKMVPGEAEKNMVVVISCSRGTFAGPRLTRVSPGDVTLNAIKGNATQDMVFAFGEINEVRVKNKDAA
jgi:hypothetical protein